MSVTIPPFRRLDGYIEAIYLDGTPAANDTAARADRITYDTVFSDGDGYVKAGNITPYNRPFAKAGIISAKVGDYCYAVVNRATGDIMVYIHTEREDLRDCDGNQIEV